ncbi:MAG: glutamyl-tRNA amidotransferase [Deltaproteobacteria bacterium RBG_16_58_17]|nr:MAG: glutamyl-tRNA amidotransferase [Deltaproteobacteria bacterium RBG_16_58_17]OHE16512.1 MAG: glutamyl-tRNA amidotransferase [Syntrophobacterales bacterium GWC2_56_13]OHE21375.1 MAG: glutamyl-tRNA amidotransferase [Syntrophobacterales bacterium GWF2_56_9]
MFKETVDREMILAAKSKDKIRLSALRMLKNGLHNREIDLKRELDEVEFLQLLSSMVKQRKDSIEQFEKGGRMDLVEKEQAELKVIEEFLPAQLSEADLDAAITEAIRETGATSARDMGKVMKVVMPKLTGRADGKAVGEKVKARLSA